MDTLKHNWNDIAEYEGSAGIAYEGDKVTVDSMLNTPIAILKFSVSPSSFYEGDFCTVQLMTNMNEMKWFTTSSKVLIKQLQEQEKNLPLKVRIVKIKRYYSIRPVTEKALAKDEYE